MGACGSEPEVDPRSDASDLGRADAQTDDVALDGLLEDDAAREDAADTVPDTLLDDAGEDAEDAGLPDVPLACEVGAEFCDGDTLLEYTETCATQFVGECEFGCVDAECAAPPECEIVTDPEIGEWPALEAPLSVQTPIWPSQSAYEVALSGDQIHLMLASGGGGGREDEKAWWTLFPVTFGKRCE